MNTTPPNILIITTDQQRVDSLGCYGSAFTRTPNIDRLGSEGAIFHRAYCANPVCTPARASIFSGQYPSRHTAWNVGMNVPESTPMLSHVLAEAGYRTHYIGKAHFQALGGGRRSRESGYEWEKAYAAWHGPYYGFQHVELGLGHATYGIRGHYGLWLKERASAADMTRFGTAERVLPGPEFGGEAYDWSMPTRLHSSVWTADRTVDFLEHHDKKKPFFLAVGFQDPHHPHCVPKDFADRVSPAKVPLPRYTEGELADKPPHFQVAREGALESSPFRGKYWVAGQGGGMDFREVDEKAARLGRAYYYTTVRLIDREVGRIMDSLEKNGLAANTLVIFTTDHGELLGDHGIWMKGPFHYEELVRIPFIVRWPAGFSGGRNVHGLVSQVDIVPTVLAALGMKAARDVDGVDFMPMIRAKRQQVHKHVFVECVDDPDHLRLKTVITPDRKLTCYHGERFGELYDLEKDPGELKNLWNSPDYATDKARLLAIAAAHPDRMEHGAERFTYA